MQVVKCSEIIFNTLSIIFIPLLFLFLTVAPLQYAARSLPGDSFAVLALLYSVGIAWFQCDSIFRSIFWKEDSVCKKWEKLEESNEGSSGSDTVGKYLCFVYKVSEIMKCS